MPGVALLALSLLGGASQAESLKIVASRDGFRPSQITIRKGETVRLLLSTADEEHCFALDALRIEKRLVPGKTVTVDVSLERPGTLAFHCCLEPGPEGIHGEIKVTD
jgi:heme/copper-type cytochrome/quinol oxidase subunit 2